MFSTLWSLISLFLFSEIFGNVLAGCHLHLGYLVQYMQNYSTWFVRIRPTGKTRFCTFPISTWTMTYHEMQRDRDSEICLIHFTLIHRLALPDTTTFLTVMLLCMIAPGLDSSITAVSVRFFLIEASLVDSPWTQQSSPGTLLTTADSQTAGTFGASPVGLLPGAYFYAHYAAYVCMSRRCSMS